MNKMQINGINAVISFDADINLFRGEFVGLNGYADFYASDVAGLKKEGEISLKVFLEACEADGVNPYKQYSGKLITRISPDLHALAAETAKAQKVSLNALIERAIQHEIAA
jgi:predicted HicB family RNase H-like nuclease